MKKYDPDSKETDAEWLRGIIMAGADKERAERSRARLARIADRLAAIDGGDDADPTPTADVKLCAWMIRHDAHGLALDTLVMALEGVDPETTPMLGTWTRVPWLDKPDAASSNAGSPHPNNEAALEGQGLDNQLDDHFDAPKIDFVSAERFVGLLRESADAVDEIIDRSTHFPSLWLVPPRLREAATRIEHATKIVTSIPSEREIPGIRLERLIWVRKILDGQDSK